MSAGQIAGAAAFLQLLMIFLVLNFVGVLVLILVHMHIASCHRKRVEPGTGSAWLLGLLLCTNLLSIVSAFLLTFYPLALLAIFVFLYNIFLLLLRRTSPKLEDEAEGAQLPEQNGALIEEELLQPSKGTSREKECPTCGRKVRADRSFCPNCDHSFDST